MPAPEPESNPTYGMSMTAWEALSELLQPAPVGVAAPRGAWRPLHETVAGTNRSRWRLAGTWWTDFQIAELNRVYGATPQILRNANFSDQEIAWICSWDKQRGDEKSPATSKQTLKDWHMEAVDLLWYLVKDSPRIIGGSRVFSAEIASLPVHHNWQRNVPYELGIWDIKFQGAWIARLTCKPHLSVEIKRLKTNREPIYRLAQGVFVNALKETFPYVRIKPDARGKVVA